MVQALEIYYNRKIHNCKQSWDNSASYATPCTLLRNWTDPGVKSTAYPVVNSIVSLEFTLTTRL